MASAEVMTTQYLETHGCSVGDARSWNPYCKRRHDLFGFIDLVALHPGRCMTIAIQATIGMNNRPARHKKIAESKEALDWVKSGRDNSIQVFTWRKIKAIRHDGKKAKREIWKPVIDEIYFDRITLKIVRDDDIEWPE